MSEPQTKKAKHGDANEIARALPKTELHLHLDGSLGLDFMFDRAVARGIEMPSKPECLHQVLRAGGAPNADPEARKKVLAAMPGHEPSSNNWLHFDFCNQFLQSKEELSAATADLVQREFREDNAVVIEIRFAPVLHCLEGLSVEEVVAAVVEGFQRGVHECTGVDVGQVIIGGVIICAMRTYPAQHGVEMAELAHRWLGKGVIGWDLAADEGAHPLEKHLQGLRRAIELQVPTTVHAGEWGSGPRSDENPRLFAQPGHHDTLPNIGLAINEGTWRLGHALTLFLDRKLLQRVAQQHVTIECCLTSNVKRIEGYHTHPIATMLRSGCLCALNSDNRFLSNTTSTLEVLHAVNDVGLTWDEVKQMLINGARASFFWCANRCSESIKQKWLSDFETRINQILLKHHLVAPTDAKRNDAIKAML